MKFSNPVFRMERLAGSSKRARFGEAGERSKGILLAEGETLLGCYDPTPRRGDVSVCPGFCPPSPGA